MVTSSDVKYILNIKKRTKPAIDKKQSEKEKKKKPEGMNRELFNLIGGNAQQITTPVSDIAVPLKEIRPGVHQAIKWVYSKFINPARTDGLELYHWQKETEVDHPYPYAKLNKKVEIVKYTDEEYKTLIEPLDNTWSKEDTDTLWSLCERYDLRFIIIQDRLNHKRSIEELKARYYLVAKTLLENRGDVNHPIVRRPYNIDYELKRKSNLQKFYSRTQENHDAEKCLMDSIKMCDQSIKKEEKEIRKLKKIIKNAPKVNGETIVQEGNKEPMEPMEPMEQVKAGLIITPVEEQKDEEDKKTRGGRRDRGSEVYLRSDMLKIPITIPEKSRKKLVQVMTELEVPNNLMPTTIVVKTYDQLKEEIMELLELEKVIEKKEKENKVLSSKIEEAQLKLDEVENKKGETGKRKYVRKSPMKEVQEEVVVEKEAESEKEVIVERESKVEKGPKPVKIRFAEQAKDSEAIAGNLRRERKQIYQNLGSKMLRIGFKYKKEKKASNKTEDSVKEDEPQIIEDTAIKDPPKEKKEIKEKEEVKDKKEKKSKKERKKEHKKEISKGAKKEPEETIEEQEIKPKRGKRTAQPPEQNLIIRAVPDEPNQDAFTYKVKVLQEGQDLTIVINKKRIRSESSTDVKKGSRKNKNISNEVEEPEKRKKKKLE